LPIRTHFLAWCAGRRERVRPLSKFAQRRGEEKQGTGGGHDSAGYPHSGSGSEERAKRSWPNTSATAMREYAIV
jgi:hypothetical protein